jgi:hypothetical protein
MDIGFFLEDIAHERFIITLTKRVLQELNINDVDFDIRNSRGGDSVGAYYRFLQDVKKQSLSFLDIIIVVSDGNCKGFSEKRRQMEEKRKSLDYNGSVVYAIPDPHIEYWYLIDEVACKEAVRSERFPDVPRRKCEKNIYKNSLISLLRSTDVEPILGGAEYGESIASLMDIGKACISDETGSFKAFISDLKQSVRLLS